MDKKRISSLLAVLLGLVAFGITMCPQTASAAITAIWESSGARDLAATDKIVNQMVPKVLWEYGVHNPSDPTYQYTDVSWPTNADAWENARTSLATIIEN